jgi:hypothetical protein
VRAAPGTDQAAPEAIATKQGGEVKEVTADLAASRRGRQKRHIARQRSEVTGVVGEPFQFESDGPEPLRAQRRFGPRQGFQGTCVRSGVSDGRVARHGLHLVDRRAVGATYKGFLDAPVLKTERDFEMEHLLPGALKTEMSRLDDARVHRSDGDLVDLPAVHTEELAHGGA